MLNLINLKKELRKLDSLSELNDLSAFINDRLLENIHKDYEKWRGGYATLNEKLSLKPGRKFIKVIRGGSVWGFVAKEDGVHKGLPMKSGDVLKAAGWSAPAKHTRGNIFDDTQDYFQWTGPNYR